MATLKAQLSPVVSLSQAFLDFKLDIQQKLIWKQEDWAGAKLVKSDRYFFCRNITHWFNSLIEVKDPKYLVITTFTSGAHPRPSFRDIILSYKAQFGLEGLCGAAQTANVNYITLFFSSQVFKLRAMQEFNLVRHSFVVHSGWLPQQPLVKFQLNRLPPDILLSDIRSELEKHVPIVSLSKEVMDLGDGDTLPTGKVYGSFKADVGISLHSLPHFVSIYPFTAHWIIYLRPAICFACKWVGHMASQCPTPFCSSCKRLLPRSHFCSAPDSLMDPSSFTEELAKPRLSGVSRSASVVIKSNVSLHVPSVSVIEEPKVAPQDFWLQDKPLFCPSVPTSRSSHNLDHCSLSDSEEENLLSSSVESVLGFSIKAAPLTKHFNASTLVGAKSGFLKSKSELPLQFPITPPPSPLWKPPKGATPLDFNSPGVIPKNYTRRFSRKK